MNTSELSELISPLYKEYDFARAFYQKLSGLSVSANTKQVNAEPIAYREGVVVSITHNGVLFEGSISSASRNKIELLIKEMKNSLQSFEKTSNAINFIEEEPLEKKFTSIENQDVPLEKKINTAKEHVIKIMQADKSVVMAQVRYRQLSDKQIYVSQKRKLEQSISRFEGIYIAVMKDEQTNDSAQVYDGYGSHGGWEKMHLPENLIDNMIRDGKKILNAKRIEPGFYDCIFSPSMSGILAHEAFGHGTESDTIIKGRAKGSDFINKRVAAKGVELYDSPALTGEAASYYFDHEGHEATTTKIVEDGILRRPITDYFSASKGGFTRSANGRREAYDHKIYSRMSNTYFLAGSNKLADMISSIKKGYFVDHATNGMEDPKGWGIQLEALYAERIENGKLTGEVFSPVIVTGYVPDILTSISQISDEIKISGLGMCGKGYKEWVKVTDGGPFLKLRSRLA